MLVGGDLDAQLAHVKSITTQLAVFGPTGYSAAENGPRFGPSDRSGRAEFVAAGCAKDLEESRRQAIADQMDCEMCHDGSDRGILTAGTSRNTIYKMLFDARRKLRAALVANGYADVEGSRRT